MPLVFFDTAGVQEFLGRLAVTGFAGFSKAASQKAVSDFAGQFDLLVPALEFSLGVPMVVEPQLAYELAVVFVLAKKFVLGPGARPSYEALTEDLPDWLTALARRTKRNQRRSTYNKWTGYARHELQGTERDYVFGWVVVAFRAVDQLIG